MYKNVLFLCAFAGAPLLGATYKNDFFRAHDFGEDPTPIASREEVNNALIAIEKICDLIANPQTTGEDFAKQYAECTEVQQFKNLDTQDQIAVLIDIFASSFIGPRMPDLSDAEILYYAKILSKACFVVNNFSPSDLQPAVNDIFAPAAQAPEGLDLSKGFDLLLYRVNGILDGMDYRSVETLLEAEAAAVIRKKIDVINEYPEVN